MAYRRIPSLNWLRVFEAAARTESFSAAASILNMSPSAVSQQISSLEHHLGEKLFERRSRRVRLSDAGALYLPTVHRALASIEDSTAELFGLEKQEQLTVQANSVFAISWLAPRIDRFHTAHPGVSLNLVCLDHFDTLASRRADIVISFGPAAWDEGDTTPLFSETIYPVAIPSVASQLSAPADLLKHRLIDVTGHRQTWRLVLGRLGLDASDSQTVSLASNTNLAFALAESQRAIALARAPATDWVMEKHGLVRCLAGFEIRGEGSYILATRPPSRRRKIAEAFRDWIVSEVAASSS